MSKKKNRFEPLEKEQIRAFDRAARQIGEKDVEMTARTLLHSGMRNAGYHHMVDKYLIDETINGKPAIRVPDYVICTGGKGEAIGQGNPNGEDLHTRGQPCYYCRTERDGYWEPKTSNGARTIPIMEEEVHELLCWWFERNDQIPFQHSGVNSRLQKVAEAAGLDREVLAHDLRHTYGTMLARMGMKPYEIMIVMGHGSIEQPMNYIQFTAMYAFEEFDDKWDFDKYL